MIIMESLNSIVSTDSSSVMLASIILERLVKDILDRIF